MGNAAFVCTYIDPCNTLCNKRQILFNNSEWESPVLIDNNSQRVSQTQENPNSKNVKLSFGKNSINEIDANHKNNRGSIINSNINTNVYSGLNSAIPNPKNNSNNMNNASNKIPVKKNNQNNNVSSFNSLNKKKQNQNEIKEIKQTKEDIPNSKNVSTIKENEIKSIEEEEEEDENEVNENKNKQQINKDIEEIYEIKMDISNNEVNN